MKKLIVVVITILLFVGISSCNKNKEVIPQNIEVQNFIWKGLNLFYFWREKTPELDDFKFKNQQQLNNFLEGFSNPNNLFESLLFDRQNTDKWSWIVDDYIALENEFKGISMSNGMEFGLVHVANNSTDIFGYIRYILPNTDAENKNLKRGNIFYAVNNTPLTVNNYRNLLFSNSNSYSISLATLNNDGTLTPTGETITLNKSEYQENPVFISKTLTINGIKIGYLMYNSFTPKFDKSLNDAILQLKNESITDLVLDLRYNGGGSVRTATYLASMITGQFDGKLFSKERWNNKIQEDLEKNNPKSLINNFSNKMLDNTPINNLNLNNLYVLVSGNTASASELIINGLKPYINVKLIGTKTVGKYVASITIYDSPDYSRNNVNPNHTWAMQPIVLEELNKLDENNKDGFKPDVLAPEDYANLGQLGNQNEPLLNAALNLITGAGKVSKFAKQPLTEVSNSKKNSLLNNTMYINSINYSLN